CARKNSRVRERFRLPETVSNTKTRSYRYGFWLNILLKLCYSPNSTSMFRQNFLK
ncbi:unnamed protein product, partial [Callosobruchus maculatus]